jgi:rhamnose transport system substrate-binding protein
MMPKLKGIPYFNACEEGAREAAEELGNVELLYDGPTVAEVDQQIEMLDNWINQQLDVIAVAANDPTALAPVLRRAKEQGILTLTWDSDVDAEKSGRLFFVNQATEEAIARTLVDVMAREAGEEAEVALISSTPTATNQSRWTKRMKAYMQERYPQMKLLVIKYPGEDQQKAMEMTADVLKTYPEVDGIWGLSSVAFPGAAEAVKKAGLTGQVAVTGLSTPANMRPYVEEGVVKTVVLWNPVDLGYLTVYVARAVADGTLKPGDTSFHAGRLGEVEVRGDQVILGEPMLFTQENIAQYDF